MKTNQVKYYPLFIFRSENFCLQTADHDILKLIFDLDNRSIKDSFSIGDKLAIKTKEGVEKKFEIKNISISNVVEDIELNKYGEISSGCTETVGEQKDALMFLHIEMTEINS